MPPHASAWKRRALRCASSANISSSTTTMPHGSLSIHFFACALDGNVNELPARFRWTPRGELREYRFPPANERCFHC